MPEPAIKPLSKAIKCDHCGNQAPMEIAMSYEQDVSFDIAEDEYNPFVVGATRKYELLLCLACKKPTLRSIYWDDAIRARREDATLDETLYPPNNKALTGLPDNIQKAYDGALSVRTIEPNAYAVLIRRVLEMVCIDRAAIGNTLYDKLADLANKSEIPAKLVNVAKGLREFGNVGAHADVGELTTAEIPILDDLSKAILEYIYNAPLLAKKAEDSLKKLKERESIKSAK